MLRYSFFSAGTMALAFMMLSYPCFAQRTAPVLKKTPPTTALQQRYKTPADLTMIPYLKAHLKTSGSSLSANRATAAAATSGATTPNFAGYVNAPIFPARNTASLSYGIFDTGVTVELGGDFNKDGKPDVAVLQEDGTLNILTGDGAGHLSAPVSYLNPNQATTNVFTANVADINGDKSPDIVAFDYTNNTMITWLNRGDGSFDAAVIAPLDMSNGYAAMAYVADVNGDGKADVIFDTTISQSNTSTAMALEVQLGAGDGTFGLPSEAKVQQFTIPAFIQLTQSGGMAVADLNGDGKMDIALGLGENFGQNGSYVVTTVLGNGDGTFSALGKVQPITVAVQGVQESFSYEVPFNTTGIFLTDITGDGKLDVISDINGVLEVAPGTGTGTFDTAVTSDYSAIVSLASSAILDVNGDGKPDIVGAGGNLAVLLGNGDGTFVPPVAGSQYITDPSGYTSLVVGDFNGDGKMDVAQLGGDYKQVSLFFNNGAGGFVGAPAIYANNDPQALFSVMVASGKYTASGYASPLILYESAIAGGTQLYTNVNNGKGTFTSVQSLAAGVPTDFEYVEPVHVDFNADGLEDLVYASTTGDVLVALSKGDGTFGTPKSIGIGTQVCPEYYGAAGDINGDGKMDLVIPYGGDTACGYLSGGASGYWIALGRGDGTFAAPVFTAFGSELYSLTLADMNGDGNLDLLINDVPFANGFGYQLSYAPGNGDGTFGSSSVVESSYVLSNVVASDINGDGKTDLVLGAEEVSGGDVTSGGIVTITGNGDGTFNAPSEIATGNFFYGLQVADMNNDGNADIVATLYQTNGQPVEYYGMITLLGYGNGQFSAPINQMESLQSTLPQIGSFYNDGAMDVMTETAYGPALFAGQGGSTLNLTASSSLLTFGQPVTLTATPTAVLAGRPAATGIVSFYDGTALLGTASLSSGVATYTAATLATGLHNVKAVYDGDTNYNLSSSLVDTVTVAALAPAFSLASANPSVSISAGAQAVVTLNLSANASFSGAVTLACSGMPTNSACTINPSTVNLTAGAMSTASLVIGTTGTQTSMKQLPAAPWGTPLAATSLATLFGAIFLRRKRARLFVMLALSVMVLTGTVLTGCSGSSQTKVPAVTAGTYTLTVTATPASGTVASSQTGTISVTIQ